MVDFGSLTLRDLRNGFAVQNRIIVALYLRELRTRFGEMKLGYAWALIEPLVHIGIMVTIFSILGRHPPLGTSFEAFFLNGYVTYTLFSQISQRSAQAITANRGLLTFPIVRNMDVVWARIILETATVCCSFALLVAIFGYLDIPVIPADAFDYILAFSSILALGAGMGILNAALTPMFKWWMMFHSWMSKFQFFFAGIFFMPDRMPPAVRDILIWNPLTHCIVWIREAFYAGYDSAILDKGYPFFVSLVLAIVGMTVERVFRRQVDAI